MGRTCPDSCCCMHCITYATLIIPRSFGIVVWKNPNYGVSNDVPDKDDPLAGVATEDIVYSGQVAHQNSFFDPHDPTLYSTSNEGVVPHTNANDASKADLAFELYPHSAADALNAYYADTKVDGIDPLYGHHGGIETHIRALASKGMHNAFDAIGMSQEFLANYPGNQCWVGVDCANCYNGGENVIENPFGRPLAKRGIGYQSSECIPSGTGNRPSISRERYRASGCNYYNEILQSIQDAYTPYSELIALPL